MREVKKKISEEEYERFSHMSYGDIISEVKKTIPMDWAIGYGWYGCRIAKIGDECFLIHDLGSSCD